MAYPSKIFKDCLSQNLLSPLLNTLSHMFDRSLNTVFEAELKNGGSDQKKCVQMLLRSEYNEAMTVTVLAKFDLSM